MCIRDSEVGALLGVVEGLHYEADLAGLDVHQYRLGRVALEDHGLHDQQAVSYTHLTLPTICSV
eukprot:1073378-Alexandrium_andersonii.AAC.1